MSTPYSPDGSPPPTAILVAKRARIKPSPKPTGLYGPSIPWLKIAIGGTIAFQAVLAVAALFYLGRGETQRIDDVDLVVQPQPIKEPHAKPEPAIVKVAEPKAIERVDDLEDLPLLKNEFVDCAVIRTDVRFMKEPAEAFQRARAEKKMVFMVHLSGNLEDEKFT